MHDEEQCRGFWRLARIEDLITGTDGLVRGASIKVKSGKLRRPVQLLYPLEIRSENERIAADSHESPTVDNADEVHRCPTQPRKNPRRAAALESEKRRRTTIETLI